MDSETYYDYIHTVLDRKNIPELKRIWYLSLAEVKGAIVRKLITDALPQIAGSNQLPPTKTFEELYNSYRTRKMQRRVRHMPQTWVKYYLEREDLSALHYALDNQIGEIRDDDIFVDEICAIIGKKSLDFVKKFLALGKKLQNYPEYTPAYVFKSAILRRNVPVMQYLFAQRKSFGEETYECIMEAGAESGDWGWITLALEKAEATGETLEHAAKGGHKDVIEFFVKELNSPSSDYYILKGYVLAQNIPRVKEILDKRQDYLDYVLYRAVEVESKAIISLILRKKASFDLTVWSRALSIAAQKSIDTLRYFYGRRKKWSANDLLGALAMAVYAEKIANARFLLEKGADPAQLPEETQKEMERLFAGEDEL